jgi:hypothetical protein
VRETRSKYCMVASDTDGFTWRRGGAAYRRPGRDTYRGDPNVGRAMEANSANVDIERLRPAHKDADHTPIDNYINHGLLDAMKRCVNHFGMQRTSVGDVVYGRPVPKMRIVVNGLVGRDTVPIRAHSRITFHLEDVALPAGVRVFIDGVMVRHDTLASNDDMIVALRHRRTNSVLIRAQKGSLRAEKTIHLDYEPPTFNRVVVSPNPRREHSFIISAEGYRDDGYWNTSDYEVLVTLDGRPLRPHPGVSRTIDNVRPGSHHVTVRIKDGARRMSTIKKAKFNVGVAGPQLAFVRPAANATVRRGSNLAVSVRASDPEGITRLSLYLDRVSEDEFNPTKLCVFPGTFGARRAEEKACNARANWTRGSHKLIAVAVDNSGQTTTIERTFRVQ